MQRTSLSGVAFGRTRIDSRRVWRCVRYGPPAVLLFPAEDSLAVVRRRWRGYARRPVSASSLCQWKLSPPRRSGWTHLRTGSGSATPVQIHLSFTPPDCTHNFVHTGTIIIPPGPET